MSALNYDINVFGIVSVEIWSLRTHQEFVNVNAIFVGAEHCSRFPPQNMPQLSAKLENTS